MAKRGTKRSRPGAVELEDPARQIVTPISADDIPNEVPLTPSEQAEVDAWNDADAESERWLERLFRREARRRGEPWPPVRPELTPEENQRVEVETRRIIDDMGRVLADDAWRRTRKRG
jgi:hypothetical protein